ncbi:MAG: NTP transferase domain-containing protein [Oscillospiraceae bacterium]|nr:NTP transferase domain-containing protein [Oscillospiraceae bacterium]
MADKTLVILAAGIGSRFGEGIKQLTPIDNNGHLIIDYSIHDAIAAGFNKIVFIIRHDIEEDFREAIGKRIEEECSRLNVEVCYAFQELTDVPIEVPAERKKPWGTGHAILCACSQIDTSFAVINADDYYGKNAFKIASDFLGDGYGLVGYRLGNTLSDNGGVTRGICRTENGRLTEIKETRNITKINDGAEASGEFIDPDSVVSMNFWCYPIQFLNVLRDGFPDFLSNMENKNTDEYLLPAIADKMIKNGTEYSLMTTDDQWFGVTYKEDRSVVEEGFRELIGNGIYRVDLYSDLLTADIQK